MRFAARFRSLISRVGQSKYVSNPFPKPKIKYLNPSDKSSCPLFTFQLTQLGRKIGDKLANSKREITKSETKSNAEIGSDNCPRGHYILECIGKHSNVEKANQFISKSEILNSIYCAIKGQREPLIYNGRERERERERRKHKQEIKEKMTHISQNMDRLSEEHRQKAKTTKSSRQRDAQK